MNSDQKDYKSDRSFLPSLLKNLLLVTTSGVVVIMLLFLVGIWRTGNRLMGGMEAMFNSPSPSPKVDVPTLIVRQIRGASELTTAVFTMEAVVPTSQDRKIGQVVVGTTKLLYIAHGKVRAGVNLSALEADDVKVADEVIQIRLPPPKILDSKIDVNRSRVYDYDQGFLGLGPDVAPQLQTLAERKTLEKIVETACTNGVLERANQRAKLTVTELLTTAGYKNVEVKMTSPPSHACQPQQTTALVNSH
jgi:hypothetical protein